MDVLAVLPGRGIEESVGIGLLVLPGESHDRPEGVIVALYFGQKVLESVPFEGIEIGFLVERQIVVDGLHVGGDVVGETLVLVGVRRDHEIEQISLESALLVSVVDEPFDRKEVAFVHLMHRYSGSVDIEVSRRADYQQRDDRYDDKQKLFTENPDRR